MSWSNHVLQAGSSLATLEFHINCFYHQPNHLCDHMATGVKATHFNSWHLTISLDRFKGDDRDLMDFEEGDGPSMPPARIGRLT